MPSERRLYLPIQAMPKLVINAFVAAEDKNFYEHPRPRFLRHRARRHALCRRISAAGRRPQGASTITQQVAKNFLLTNELSFDAQDQGSAARAADRAHLFEGQDSRALSQRDLSRVRRLWHRRRLAALFRQVGARADIAEAAYLAGAAEGPEQLQSVPPPRRGDRAAQLRDRPHGRGRLHPAAAGEKAKKEPLDVTRTADRRAHLRRRIFRRGSAPLDLRQLRREEALRGRPVGAHHARSQDAGAGAQGA